MLKHTPVAGLIVAWLAMAPLPAAAVPIISAPFVTVGVGDTFAVDISITDAVDLIGWQFDLAFDPSIVVANSVTEGPFMSDFGTTLVPPTTFGSGIITTGSIFGVSNSFNDLPPNPFGSGVLATILFTALAAGVSPLTFSNTFLNFDDDGFAVANGQITVVDRAFVPEPASAVLLSSGLVLLSLWQRARRGRRQGPDERKQVRQ